MVLVIHAISQTYSIPLSTFFCDPWCTKFALLMYWMYISDIVISWSIPYSPCGTSYESRHVNTDWLSQALLVLYS